MKMKIAALSLAVLLSTESQAGIPVTDAASIATNVLNQVETIAQWATQYQQMIEQLEKMQEELDAITGSRGMGTIYNDPQYRDYLPADWQNVYDNVMRGGLNGLSGDARNLYYNSRIFERCNQVRDYYRKKACEASAAGSAQDMAFAKAAYSKARDRLNQINELMYQIDSTEDPKEMQELNGRIAAEQALIDNEAQKLELYRMMAASSREMRQEREKQLKPLRRLYTRSIHANTNF